MAGCDFQAVPGGRAERRASAARPPPRLLEDELCTRPVNHSGASYEASAAKRLKEKKMPPLAAARASKNPV